MPIAAHFAHIRERDARTGLLTLVADVPTRKMTAVYRFCERDERPADFGRCHLPQRPAFPHSYSGCFICRIHTFLSGRRPACLTTSLYIHKNIHTHPPYFHCMCVDRKSTRLNSS